MSTSRKIIFAVLIVLVAGSIWYLESMKAHPTGSGVIQQINIPPSGPIFEPATSTVGLSSSSVPEQTDVATATPPTIPTVTPGNMPLPANSPAVLTALQSLAKTDQASDFDPAREIQDPTGFVNASSSFRLANLIGHDVILLDFWTYSCINCIRTLPYLTAWYGKYKDYGLVVVGIHTPEFDFEKNIANVEAAATQYGIKYPIVLDSNYGTWDAYGNLYWPHEYLIDMAGYIVHDQVGEGNYAETESKIQQLLVERAGILGLNFADIPTSTVDVSAVVPSQGETSPETYFGAERNQYLANGEAMVNGEQSLTEPQSTAINANSLYLAGTWNFDDQYATNVDAGAKVIYEYQAARVYFVASASSPSSPVTVEVLQDGKPISAAASGSDVVNGKVTITSSRLYSLVANPDGVGTHTLELIIDNPGLQAFTFTFG